MPDHDDMPGWKVGRIEPNRSRPRTCPICGRSMPGAEYDFVTYATCMVSVSGFGRSRQAAKDDAMFRARKFQRRMDAYDRQARQWCRCRPAAA